VRVRERKECRRAYNWKAAGVPPGRGVYGLAAGGGEHGQKEIDKEASCCCARESRGVGRGLWRGTGSGVLSRLGERTSTQRPPAVRRKNVYQGAVGRDGVEKSKGYVLPGKARGVTEDASGEATRAMGAFPIPWPTRVLRQHASHTGAIQAKGTSGRRREGGR
jgi:hypothetical protein